MIQDPIWARADALFDAALDLPSEERTLWLDAVCRDEPEMKAQVERLLELTENCGSDLEACRSSATLARELAERLAQRWAAESRRKP